MSFALLKLLKAAPEALCSQPTLPACTYGASCVGWVTSATSVSEESADSSNTVQDAGSQPVLACDLHFVTCVNEGACAGYGLSVDMRVSFDW